MFCASYQLPSMAVERSADDAARCADGDVLVLRLGAFAHEACRDAVGGAVAAVVVAGVYRVGFHSGDFHSREPLLVFDALLEPRALVEGLEAVVLDERDAADKDVVDFGTELHALVLLAIDTSCN